MLLWCEDEARRIARRIARREIPVQNKCQNKWNKIIIIIFVI